MGRYLLAMACVMSMLVAAPCADAAKKQPAPSYAADPFSLEVPQPLKPGQVELVTISTQPGAVTDGQVLVEIRGLRAGDRVQLYRNRRKLARRGFPLVRGGVRRGVVSKLRVGLSKLTVRVHGKGRRRQIATLTVRNHPIWGPVISGPHQTPFYCETKKAGLGEPLDANCSARPREDWYYRTRNGGAFHKLAKPFAAYPPETDVAKTSTGKRVPFVVRVDSRTINRGIARIAVLDDPHKRGPRKGFEAASWNRELTYSFGESCGPGYHQGTNSPDTVLGGPPDLAKISGDNLFAGLYGLADQLSKGDVVAASTLTTFGVHCNPLVSAETLMLMKEHITESYGIPNRTIGVGGSGGALQQYNAVNNAPGLLDGALPIASFTDIPSTAMTTVDCGLLQHYWDTTASSWNFLQKGAVTGQLSTQICRDWTVEFLPVLDPSKGCSGAVPQRVRYDPQTNPRGVRCDIQDANVNVYGRDPVTGFARRPYDNTGVQYGLRALQLGQITPGQFIDLNRRIGGFDINAHPQPQRDAMDEQTARTTYRLGGIVGRGSIARTPIIDMATYLDAVPLLDIHDVIRPFMHRERLRKYQGSDRSQAIWRGLSTPGDVYPAIKKWIAAVDRSGGHTARVVRASQPAEASDRCIISALGSRIESDTIIGPLGFKLPVSLALPELPIGVPIPERQEARSGGICQGIFTARSEPRLVAGGPLTDDVIKCALKPVDTADYYGRLTASQVDQLRDIFPTGVCDWSQPGIGETATSIEWPTVGGEKLQKPRSLRWTVARSKREK